MLKLTLCVSLCFFLTALSSFGELTDADLDKIRLIVNKEVEPIKTNVARLEGRLTGIEKQVSHATNVTYGLIALIVVAIDVPAWYSRKDREDSKKIETLIQRIEALEQQRIVKP